MAVGTAYLLSSIAVDSYSATTFGAISSAALTSSVSPLGLAISPDGTRIYTTDTNNGEINVITVSPYAPLTSFSLTTTAGNGPRACCVSPDNAHLFVTSRGDNKLFIIETVTFTTIATLIGFVSPWGVSVSPSGDTLYICNQGSSTLAVVDITTITAPSITTTVAVGTAPTNNVITPSGAQVYTADVGSGTSTAVNTGTLVPTSITVGSGPISLCVLPNGLFVYVANSTSSNVSVINTGSNTVSATVGLTGGADGIAATPDSLAVWCAESNPTFLIEVITVASNTVTHSISTGGTGYSNVVMTPASPASTEQIVMIV